MRFLVLLALTACLRPVRVTVTQPLKVEPIRATIERSTDWGCAMMDEPPPAPAELEIVTGTEDVINRVFVHIRQYNDAVEWMKAATAWMNDMRLCMERLQ